MLSPEQTSLEQAHSDPTYVRSPLTAPSTATPLLREHLEGPQPPLHHALWEDDKIWARAVSDI